MKITSGVAQGSILGPDLWDASYDSLLRLDMPEESRLGGYADDVAALLCGRTVEQAKTRLDILMRRVSGWMTAHDFSLALEKIEVVILTRRRIPTLRPISGGELTIESKPAVKYLGLMLDSKMSFFGQIKAAADRAAAGVAALSRLMANAGSRYLLGDVSLWEERSRFSNMMRSYERIPLTTRRIVRALLNCRGGELCKWYLLIAPFPNRL